MSLPLTPEEWSKMVQIAPGVLVEADVLDIVEWIRNYHPNLDVVYLDPTRFDLSIDDPPYKVIERCNDGMTRVVFSCWTLDNRVKERIIAADTQHSDILGSMEKTEQALKNDKKRRFKDEMAEAHDLAAHLLRNPKTSYTFHDSDGDLITVEDDRGVVKRAINRDNQESAEDLW
jgi:hypothetical protein